MESKSLTLSPEADRATLIRRLSLDLLGLLPTPEEVDDFIADTHPNAYERVVDRLLDSPHFGERWGRHWLDMARYADSDGYEKDNPRPDAYRWRDWVIDAINADMPYDQFTIEQLAGDLLPDATDMQRLATAFHRQTLTNTEGGTDQEEFRVAACFDRTETTGSVWLGLTVGCARCHTHKYDAITQREYYQLFAFFNNGDEQTHVVPKSISDIQAYKIAKAEYDQQVAALRQKLADAEAQFDPEYQAWQAETLKAVETAKEKPLRRQAIKPTEVTSDPATKLDVQKDNSILASGDNPETAIYTITGKVSSTFDTLRLDALSDKSLPAKGPGRVAHGNFVLSEITLEVSKDSTFSEPISIAFDDARADFEQVDKPWLARHAFDGNTETGWAVAPQFGKNHWAEFHIKDPQLLSDKPFIRIKLIQKYGKQHTLGRFKLHVQTGFDSGLTLPENIVQALSTSKSDRKAEDEQTLRDYFSKQAKATKPIHAELEALAKKEPPKPELTVRVLAQRTKEPRPTFVLRRGEFLQPLEDAKVDPSGLATLPQLTSRHGSAAAPDRLDLARWLVSSDNPLTPRVTVNHIWRTLFGNGLVRTASDFGVRGEPPTHPELLDWLAARFIGKYRDASDTTGIAWSRKQLIKLIVMSATYRQSSKIQASAQETDPQNMWLSRQNRLRVEGEIVRDISLDAAGLLSRKVGGPSVYPSLPPGIAELSYAGNFKWTTSTGDDKYRRGMYTFFKRTAPHPNLITFDCPDANLACVSRNSSNTPLQALVALNNASFAEAARGLANRALKDTTLTNDSERIVRAFRWCMGRVPTDFERGELLNMLSSSRAWYSAHTDEASKLIEEFKIDNLPTDEHAAWIATTRVLLNLDEFITRE